MSIPIDQEIRILRSLFWSDRDPDGRAFVPLADAYRRAGDFRQAIELLSQGLERHPDFASAHAAAGRLYLEKGLLEEAEIAARKVLELDKDNVMGLELLASALEQRGAPDEAAELRARLLELTGPRRVYGESGAVEADPEEILEVGALAPDAEVVEAEEAEEEVLEIGALAPDAGVAEEAEEEVFQIATLAPDPVEAEEAEEEVFEIATLAPAEEPAEELEEAAEDAFEIAALAPEADVPSDDAPLITRTMAELYARQGLTDRALSVFRQLLEATPGDPGLRRRIAEIEAEAAEEEGPPETPEPEPAGFDEYVRGHAWDASAQRELHEVDTPFAWTEEDPDDMPEPGPSIGGYFERLLAWRPSDDEPESGPRP